ncbi:MAG: acyl-CoA reductase [Myxococcota bacterium]
MTRLEITWPDEAAERVRAAEGRLRVAGEALARRPFEDRLAAVAAVLADWTAADSPWRRELAAALAEATPFAGATIREGLDAALRAWRPADLVACAEREIDGARADGRRALVPYEWTTVIAGGALPMPTLLSSLLPLILGSPVLLRETAKDPVTARMLARSLAARDEGLAAAFEPIAFSSDDGMALDAALAAPCVVATGSDETLDAISRRLDRAQRFVGYGHRFSIAVFGPALAAEAEAGVAAGLALDVARWDQTGCLSPVVAYLVGWDDARARRFATAIDAALERVSAESPRGEVTLETAAAIANERSEARMRSTLGEAMLFEGAQHTVVLESDARPRPAPLGRFLRLMPVESDVALNRALEPFSGHLSNVCVFGFSEDGEGRLLESHSDAPAPSRVDARSTATEVPAAWSRLGVSRLTTPGRLQTPPVDWPHDGLPLLLPLARFACDDRDRPTREVD